MTGSEVEHIVLIGLDGVRPDVLLEANTPNMDALAENGSYSWNAWSVYPSVTLANWPSIFTSTTPGIHGVIDWLGEIYAESMCEVFDEVGLSTVLSGQDQIIAGYSATYATGYYSVPNPDVYYTDIAIELFENYNPFFLGVYNPVPDEVAHEYGHESPEYQEAIENADVQIGRILNMLMEQGVFDQTLIVVTTDHGMTGQSHSERLITNRRIFTIFKGPGVKQGYEMENAVPVPNPESPGEDYYVGHLTIDTAPTITALAGLRTPADAEGEVLDQIFLPPSVPALLSPENGSYTNDNTPKFEWLSVTHPLGVTYTLQYFTENSFGWGFTRPITIYNGGLSDLVDHQVLVTLDTASLIAENKLRSDAGDLRFFDSNSQELPHWIESGVNTSSTKIWVRVPLIPVSNSTIHVYYGNPIATSAENGDATFEFFDNFDTGVLTDKWDNLDAINPGYFAYSGGYLVRSTTAGNADLPIKNTFSVPDDFIVEFDGKIQTSSSWIYVGAATRWVDQNNHYCDFFDSTTSQKATSETKVVGGQRINVASASDGITQGAWHKIKIVGHGATREIYADGNLYLTAVDSTFSSGRVGVYSYRGNAWWDNYRVRKHALPEPTTSVGEEEELPMSTWTIENLAENTYTVPDEEALVNGTYYWHVRAVDGLGNESDWSDNWQFTIADVWVQTKWGGVATYPNTQVGTWDNTYDNWYRHDKVAPNAENIVGPRTGSGYLESSVYDAGAIVNWDNVEFETAGVGTAKVYLRFDNDNDLSDQEWIQVANGASLNIQARYVQYKVELTGAWAIPYYWPTTIPLTDRWVTVVPQKTFREIRIYYSP